VWAALQEAVRAEPDCAGWMIEDREAA